MMSLRVILKPSCADTRFCPSLCCVAEPVVCPWGGLPVHRRDGKGGLGRHQRAPSARGGAGRPKWEGEGRMAYMPEVRNGLAEQAGEEVGSLKGGTATGLVTS